MVIIAPFVGLIVEDIYYVNENKLTINLINLKIKLTIKFDFSRVSW